jgi:hypothetical protein
LATGLLCAISALIAFLAEHDATRWIGSLRIWELCLRLPLGIIVVSGIIYFGAWLTSRTREKKYMSINAFVFVFSLLILFGTLNMLQWLDDRALDAQLDTVQAICEKGFEDPSTLDQYNVTGAVVGYWDYVLVWEDESRKSIWFDSCSSLNSCGVFCLREGASLEDLHLNYDGHEFQYIREGLYGWN